MGYSVHTFISNLSKLWNRFYHYLLYACYYGLLPTMFLVGLYLPPRSPMLQMAWAYITGDDHGSGGHYEMGGYPGGGRY